MKYTATKGQLITFWIFGAFIWFWSLANVLDSFSESNLALPIFFLLPAGLIYYTLGWKKHNPREKVLKHEKSFQQHTEDQEHDHNKCEKKNLKYRNHGIFWLVVPIGLLIAVLFVYAITSFVVSSGEMSDTTSSAISILLGFIGIVAVMGIFCGIPIGIINLSKRKYCVDKFDHRSGQGDDSIVPDEVRRWNWGAFTFGWIWGITHDVWLSLLTFIPYVNFIVMIYLGIKGNELAWKKCKWESVEKFHVNEKKWAFAAVIYLLILISLGIIGILTIYLNSDSDSEYTTTDIETNVGYPVKGKPLTTQELFGE